MAVITEAAIRELAGIRGDVAPITSCYLDVDGRRLVRHQDVEHELDGVLREARQRANGHRSVHDDLRRIEAFVKGGFDRSATRGLAFFACAATDLWEVIELPKPVRSCLVINHAPAVGQLESIVQEHEPIGVLLADKQRAQLYVFELGQLVDRSELLDELPARLRQPRRAGARHPRSTTGTSWRTSTCATRPGRRSTCGRPAGFHHLAIGALRQHRQRARADAAPVPAGAAVRPGPGGRRRLAGRGAGRRRGRRGRGRAARGRPRWWPSSRRPPPPVAAAWPGWPAPSRRCRSTASSGSSCRRATARQGWRCPDTGALALVGPKHPDTGAAMERVNDVVEDAIEEALTQGIPVTICVGNADLDVLGRIGALLRY